MHFSFPSETGWRLISSDSTEIAGAPPGTYALNSETVVSEKVEVAKGEEHTFVLLDSVGDGSKLFKYQELSVGVRF